jgi:hypothetical protein
MGRTQEPRMRQHSSGLSTDQTPSANRTSPHAESRQHGATAGYQRQPRGGRAAFVGLLPTLALAIALLPVTTLDAADVTISTRLAPASPVVAAGGQRATPLVDDPENAIDAFVPIDEARLAAVTLSMMTLGSVVELPTAQGPLRMRLVQRGRTELGSTSYIFAGGPDTDAPVGSNATLVVRDGLVAGFVRGMDGFDVIVTPLDEWRQSLTFQPSAIGDCGNTPAMGKPFDPNVQAGGQAGDGGIAGACSDPDTIQDVLVVYTPAAAAANGGSVAIAGLIEAGILDANIALKNSQAPNRLRLVAIYGYDFPESGDIFTDLDTLTDPVDGVGDFVHTLRDLFAADLVQLVADAPGACGLAWLFENDPSRGFSVVDAACLANYTPAHEIGHNFGACHAVGDGGGCEDGGYFPFSNGHRYFGDSSTLWRTVMAYAPGTRIPYYSNPSVLFDGEPVGVPGSAPTSADNTRTIQLTAAAVSNFRCDGEEPKDCNSNGLPDLIDVLDGSSEDCNGNGIPDECDIAGGFSADANFDGIPDECATLPAKFYPEDDDDPRVLDAAGFSVAIGRGLAPVGTTVPLNAVVGAFGDDEGGANVGAAYVFTPLGVQQAKLIPSDPDPQSNFGRAVDTWSFIPSALTPKREFAIAGAYRADAGGLNERGAVYVFSSDNDGAWAQRHKQLASDGKAGDWFGFAVNMTRSPADAQHNLFVGAPNGNAGKGAVYIYRYLDGNTTTLSKKLILPLSDVGSDFGWSLASDNFVTLITPPPISFTQRAILVAGAPGFSDDAGLVRVFERPTTPNATYPSAGTTISLGPDQSQDGDRFGEAVAIADNYLVIGAPGRNEGRGAAFVYERTNVGVWQQRVALTFTNGKPNDRLGSSVSITTATDGALWVVVGAPRFDKPTASGTLTDAGTVVVLRKPANSPTWSVMNANLPGDTAAGDQFGQSAAIYTSGASVRALIGAPFDDDSGVNSGSLYNLLPTLP